MRIFSQNEPLTEAELDRLEEFLKSCKGGKAMNIEEVDGFFAALVAGPEIVMPSEYLPEVLGGEMADTHEFGSFDEANDILALMMRHWNDIAATLSKDEVYLPILLDDENGVAHGNDWARGFMRGVGLRHDGTIRVRAVPGRNISVAVAAHPYTKLLLLAPRKTTRTMHSSCHDPGKPAYWTLSQAPVLDGGSLVRFARYTAK